MKNRILFISLAVVLALSVGLVACDDEQPPPEAPESIVVGSVRDLDQDLAYFECHAGGPVMRWFVDKVNSEGGVYLSEYEESVPIELVVEDFDSATWDIADVTQELIDDGADFIWGGPCTDCILTQALVCNYNEVLLLTFEGGATSMIWNGDIDNWPYMWVSQSFSNWYQIPVLYDMLLAQGISEPRAYVVYIENEHGYEYLDAINEVFGEETVIDAVGHASVITPEEATAIIESAINSLGDPSYPDYDIFCAFTYPWNVWALTQAAIDNGFNPPAIVWGPGGNANIFATLFGPNVEGMMSFIVADVAQSSAISELYDELTAQCELDWDNDTILCDPGAMTSGFDSLDFWGMPCYAAGLQMWQAAVENAGKLDPTAVRAELASFTEANPVETVLGATWFTVFGNGNGGGLLAYECHPGEIGQWQGGYYRNVGGNHPTALFNFPMTDQWCWIAAECGAQFVTYQVRVNHQITIYCDNNPTNVIDAWGIPRHIVDVTPMTYGVGGAADVTGLSVGTATVVIECGSGTKVCAVKVVP